MNILILPNSQKPFDIDKSNGGLVSVHKQVLANLCKEFNVTIVSYGNENLGWVKNHVENICVDKPLGNKFTNTINAALAKTLKAIDLTKFDTIIMFEAKKTLLDVIKSQNCSDKVVNILATPLFTKSRGIINLYACAALNHKYGGKNYVQTKAFIEQIALYNGQANTYLLNPETSSSPIIELLNKYLINGIKFVEDDIIPVGIVDELNVKEAENYFVSAQRWDSTFRKTEVAYKALDRSGKEFLFYCPSSWIPSLKKYPNIIVDERFSVIQDKISMAKAIINTCHNTGTVENASFEAISKGVPVIQLLEKGAPHATLEFDPNTVVVEIEKGESKESIIEKYMKAIAEFEDTIDARLERAKSMYERYNKAEYIKQWKIILGAL